MLKGIAQDLGRKMMHRKRCKETSEGGNSAERCRLG
jgi:hypothetical protein